MLKKVPKNAYSNIHEIFLKKYFLFILKTDEYKIGGNKIIIKIGSKVSLIVFPIALFLKKFNPKPAIIPIVTVKREDYIG